MNSPQNKARRSPEAQNCESADLHPQITSSEPRVPKTYLRAGCSRRRGTPSASGRAVWGETYSGRCRVGEE
ncbi:hypothetical protein NDU88_005133 [Pleurodeles waltl]|uniref:Uncharacterized protein n=1 Tax=Pleurodeles waltl TaxID=8319 RepID=A0AAV7KZT4_PLEWA|nr:hypothetical protein NDU88_005133 [Pleurodeles waltl]